MSVDSVQKRDLRIDLVRGIALLVLFSDHIPGNIVARWTPVAVRLADCSDVFIFLSGYSCGIAYGRRLEKGGVLCCLGRAWKRAAQLYAAKVAVTMLTLGIIVLGADRITPIFFGTPWSLSLVETRPFETLVEIELFRLELFQFFVLALYIPFLVALPLVLVGLVQYPRVMFFISMGTYSAVQLCPELMTLPEPWRGAFFFNPFAWQFLFFSACALALMKPDERAQRRPSLSLMILAMVVFAIAIFVRVHFDVLPRFLGDKRNLGLLRLIHFVSTFVVGWRLIPSSERLRNITLLSPFLTLGKYPLVGYCTGGVLAVLGEMVLNTFDGHWKAQVTVNVCGWIGCLAMAACWGILWQRFRRRPGIS